MRPYILLIEIIEQDRESGATPDSRGEGLPHQSEKNIAAADVLRENESTMRESFSAN